MSSADMHKALEEAAGHCVATANDCLRHCLGMYDDEGHEHAGMRGRGLSGRRRLRALQALAAVNSPHVAAVAKGVEPICKACQTECEKFPDIAECKACGEFLQGMRRGMRQGCLKANRISRPGRCECRGVPRPYAAGRARPWTGRLSG